MSNMLVKLWNRISSIGINADVRESEIRNVIVTNRIIFIMTFLSMIFSIISAVSYAMSDLSIIVSFGYLIALLATFLLNIRGLTVIARIFLSFFLPSYTLFASIYFKILRPDDIQDYQFYASRIIILVFAVLPIVYFDLKDRVQLVLSLLGGFLCILLFDPIHDLFGVGYHELGFTDDRYSFINVVMILTYLFFFGTMIFLKRLIEEYEMRNITLIRTLRKKNESLNFLNTELESRKSELELQKEELNSQKEELTANQEKLIQLNSVIDEQREKLELINKDLESDLEMKNDHLIQANNELIRNNNELRQFSYTISHNLRGPLASLMGLTGILAEKEYDDETKSVIEFIQDSVNKLDDTIKDLNKVLDIRNSVNQIRENVLLSDEIDKVTKALDQEINGSNVMIKKNIKILQVYSVRAIINSILYNLISNAIKFRSPEREPEILISTDTDGENLLLKVKDNGLGMDLEYYQADLFKMYKRFHLHTEGRGLGLYLTNLQVEILNGKIEITSKHSQGSEFRVLLPLVTNKILLDNDFVELEYDTILDAAIVQWKGKVSGSDFRHTLTEIIELLSDHTIVNWISDIRKRETIDKDDIEWMFKNIFPRAISEGVRNIIIVTDENTSNVGLKKAFDSRVSNVGMKVIFFSELNSARDFLKQESGEAIL